MQDFKRLKVGAVLGNSPEGILYANIQEYDGGPFQLVSKKFDEGVVLVDPNRPASYGFQISGSPEALKQLGNALLAISRSSGGDADADSDDSTDA